MNRTMPTITPEARDLVILSALTLLAHGEPDLCRQLQQMFHFDSEDLFKLQHIDRHRKHPSLDTR